MPDRQIDGHDIEQWQGRFTKPFDIDQDNLDEMRLDKVVVWVVATRAGDSNFKVLDSGEVRKVTVYKVEDAAPLSGELRDQAINFLAHNDQSYFRISAPGYANPEPEADDPADRETGEVKSDGKAGTLVCEEHGRYFAEDGCEGCTEAVEDKWADKLREGLEGPADQGDLDAVSDTAVSEAPPSPAGGPELVERLDAYKDGATPEPSGGDGPKVAPFNPETFDGPAGGELPPVGDREFIGSIYPDGHKGKDKVLQRAMEAPEL